MIFTVWAKTDEFVIVIPDIERKGDVVFELGGIADKIIASTGGEFNIGNHKVHSGMSIGISLYPKDGETPDELVKNADTAMYHAKKLGRHRYEFYAPELNEAALHRLNLEQELRGALDNNEFSIYYQPKVDSLSGRLVGVEALIRWRHPEKGIVPPSDFIAVAEETGLIRPIDDWVLSTVCHQMAGCGASCDPGCRQCITTPVQGN
ncbi:MAG: EAL domain-containing protein [Thiogranum sp.]